MLRLDDNKYFTTKLTYFFWLLMSFQAGYVNVGAFFTSGSFASHVTGTSSRIGMGIADLDMMVLATFITVLMAFILGAAFAGHFIGRPQQEGVDPEYTLVLSVKACFFGLVLYFSSDSHVLAFMSPHAIKLAVIFMLSFCCGVQNSTCALSTGGFLKPTHMTGLSTDIGIFLAKNFAPDASAEDKRKNRLRISILSSFIFGGVMASVIFSSNGHYGFLFPFLSSLGFLAMGVIRDRRKHAGEQGWEHRTATGSIMVTFLMTLAIGVSAYLDQ